VAIPIQPNRALLRPFEAIEERPSSISAGGASSSSFGDLFKKAINDTSDLQNDAQEMIQSFLRGDPVELHQVMAASEEAGISLELLVEIRNKLTDAYRTVMNMQ
jgi:flagellar hook-basal body complex protein FliE